MGAPHILTWDDARIAQLKQLWADGDTATQIAAALGTTRNAVLGKAHRLQLPERLRAAPAYRAPRPPREPREHARHYPAIRYREPPTELICVAAESRLCSLLELTPSSCRWPIGDPQTKDFAFCGGQTAQNSYCRFHANLAYEPKRSHKRPFIPHGAAA